jgi:mono/diheme cytochrome c family protein
MKRLLLSACLVVVSSCSQPVWGDKSATASVESGNCGQALIVLEHQCVHCHGDNRLSSMPPINDTHALSKLIGSHWIVPGKPQASRFFQVVTFPDEIPGAMPPSGHAISKKDVHILRDWIKAGAKLPAQNVKLIPLGPLPRSI